MPPRFFVPPIGVLHAAVLAAMVAGLPACGGVAPSRSLDTRVHRSLSEWTREYGEPHAVRDLGGGGGEVTWRWSTTRIIGGRRGEPTPQVQTTPQGGAVTTVVPGEYVPPQLKRLICTLTATVDAAQTVTAAQAEGDGCLDLLAFPELRETAPPQTLP